MVIALVLQIQAVFAHGSMKDPISRIYACYLENPETPDCLACRDAIAAGGTQALYDWNEVTNAMRPAIPIQDKTNHSISGLYPGETP